VADAEGLRSSPSGEERRPEVTVILIGYQTRQELARALPSLLASSPGLAMEVVLVDNASGDGTAAWVREAFPTVRLVALEENVGFGRAVNLAADLARGEYLLLLNPDTEVRPGAVEAMVTFARANPQAGLVGGRTLTDDGRTEPSCCWARPTLWSTFCFATGLSTALRGNRIFDPEAMAGWDRDTVREVGVVTGCLLMASSETWRELGGFDPRFFMYGEDTDLSMRAHQAGYRPAITPAAEVVHTLGGSSAVPANRRVMISRGKVTLFRKHWGPLKGNLAVGLLAMGVGLRAALVRVTGRLPGRAGEDREGWAGAWRRRAEWLGGYPPYTPGDPSRPLPMDAASLSGRATTAPAAAGGPTHPGG
jgi:N-acetylglucosaminyl-diphospho-decaprenol L-rhamnosyltransferase